MKAITVSEFKYAVTACWDGKHRRVRFRARTKDEAFQWCAWVQSHEPETEPEIVPLHLQEVGMDLQRLLLELSEVDPATCKRLSGYAVFQFFTGDGQPLLVTVPETDHRTGYLINEVVEAACLRRGWFFACRYLRNDVPWAAEIQIDEINEVRNFGATRTEAMLRTYLMAIRVMEEVGNG